MHTFFLKNAVFNHKIKHTFCGKELIKTKKSLNLWLDCFKLINSIEEKNDTITNWLIKKCYLTFLFQNFQINFFFYLC